MDAFVQAATTWAIYALLFISGGVLGYAVRYAHRRKHDKARVGEIAAHAARAITYRDELAAAHARIAALERGLANAPPPM